MECSHRSESVCYRSDSRSRARWNRVDSFNLQRRCVALHDDPSPHEARGCPPSKQAARARTLSPQPGRPRTHTRQVPFRKDPHRCGSVTTILMISLYIMFSLYS
jgi:hypothetical protein